MLFMLMSLARPGYRNNKVTQCLTDPIRVLLAYIVTEKGTGKSRGFGYVTFFDQQDAEEAIKAIDGLVRCNCFDTFL